MRSSIALVAVALAAGAVAAPQNVKTVTLNGVEAVLSTSTPDAEAMASFQCPSGTALGVPSTSLAKCQGALGHWVASAPGRLISGSGDGSVGATRFWATTDASLQETTNNAEVLTNVVLPASGNSNLRQQWSTTAPEVYGGLTLAQSWHDLTVQQQSVTLQYFINTCASSQSAAYPVLAKILQDGVATWIGDCQR